MKLLCPQKSRLLLPALLLAFFCLFGFGKQSKAAEVLLYNVGDTYPNSFCCFSSGAVYSQKIFISAGSVNYVKFKTRAAATYFDIQRVPTSEVVYTSDEVAGSNGDQVEWAFPDVDLEAGDYYFRFYNQGGSAYYNPNTNGGALGFGVPGVYFDASIGMIGQIGYSDQYGIGVDNPNYTSTGLFFFDNPYDCATNSTCRINYFYNESVWTPYDYLELQTATGTLISTSTIIASPDPLGAKSDGHSYFTITETASTTNLVFYNVVGHLAAYYDVILGDVAATTTIPYVLSVNWAPGEWRDITELFTATSSSDIIDTHKLACTDEQWAANASIPILGINVERMLCNTKQWVLDVGIKPTQTLLDKLKGLASKIGNMFPFSLLKTINNSWSNESKNLVSFLSIKAANAEGYATSTGVYDNAGADGFNISINNFIGTTGTTTLSLFSKSGMISAVGQTGFDIYYWTCRAFIWVLLLAFLWELITERSHKELL